MHTRLLLLCLLVAAVSAHQVSLSQPTPHLIRKTVRLQPRLLAGIGTSDGSSTDTGDGSSSDTGTGSGSESGSESQSGSGSGSETGSGNTDTDTDTASASSSSSSDPTSTSSSTARSTSTAPTSTSISSSQRAKTTSYQSTFTAANTAAVSSSTNAAGSVVVLTSTVEQPSSSSTSDALASSTQSASSESDSSGGHMGLIIGVSVVGGVAVIGALIFLWMKFGGKRFSDYQDEDHDIKWPELKAEGDAAALQPLPARRTGGAGFDMGNEFDDGQEGDTHSMAEYGAKGRDSMAGSTTALNAGVGAGAAAVYGSGMEGNYHDESPSATNHYSQPVAGYYDPYSGYPAGQSQHFYPEQTHEVVPGGQQYEGYQDFHNQADPYAAARAQAASVSPPMQPYRVGGQSMHQGY